MSWPATSRHARGYNSAWHRIRLDVLRRDNGLCQCERCAGGRIRVTPAGEVHHITSKADAKRMGWTQQQTESMANLQAINSECHKRETAAAQGRTLKPRVRIALDGYPIERPA